MTFNQWPGSKAYYL